MFTSGLISGLALCLLLAGGMALAEREQARTAAVKPQAGELAGTTFYHNAHALLVGINQYPHLKRERWLTAAERDATDMARLLVRSYGFLPENVTVLLGPQATQNAINRALAALADETTVPKDDAVRAQVPALQTRPQQAP